MKFILICIKCKAIKYGAFWKAEEFIDKETKIKIQNIKKVYSYCPKCLNTIYHRYDINNLN